MASLNDTSDCVPDVAEVYSDRNEEKLSSMSSGNSVLLLPRDPGVDGVVGMAGAGAGDAGTLLEGLLWLRLSLLVVVVVVVVVVVLLTA